MSGVLKYFGKNHRFSHFHPCTITAFGQSWQTAEQLYQCIKAEMAELEELAHEIFEEPTGPGQKRLSKQIPKSYLWQQLQVLVMLNVDFQKYEQNPALKDFLLSSGNRFLLENNPHDPFWGPPRNAAGTILMDLRSHFRNSSAASLPETIIVGDSILKHVKGESVKKGAVCVSLPGAKLGYIRRAAKFVTGPYVKTVVVFGGTNDLVSRDDKPRLGPDKLFQRIQLLVDDFSKFAPWAKLYVATILNRPRSEKPRAISHISKYNKLLVESEFEGVNVIDLGQFPNSHFAHDGIHVNDKGTRQLEIIFSQALQ